MTMPMILLLAAVASFTPPQVDPELAAFVAARRRVMDDASRPIAEREAVALEVAATLDRAAWAASAPAARRAAWAEARAVLDGFTSREKGHPRARDFAFQAAVYLWAEGQSWARQAGRDPADGSARARAASAFEGAAARLRPLVDAMGAEDSALAQNARFRLAEALFDRFDLDPGQRAAAAERKESLTVLNARPITEARLKGYAALLRAELLAAAGRFDEAGAALAESAKSDPAPPVADRLAALVPIAAGRKEFDAARKEIDAAALDAGPKGILLLRLALAERSSLDPGEGRARAEAEAFRRVRALKEANAPEFRAAVVELAKAVDEPASTAEPDAWSLLAEGAALLGQPDRAARLDIIAAAKAEGRGDAATARTLRFRAGAVLFQAGRFARADGILSRVVDDPGAGSLRARAGMLRAMARGRGLAAGEAGPTRESYVSALKDQVAHFPDDPATGEARWLLGRARLEAGDRAGAEASWGSVPRSHARWIDARMAMAALHREDLDGRRLVDDPASLAAGRDAARAFLEKVRSEARDDSERSDVMLEEIRLDLIPGAGEPKRALEEVERLRRLPLRLDQRGQADRLRIVALAACEKFLDAEKAALALSTSIDEGLPLARDLDRAASAATIERVERRIGGIERIVADRLPTTGGTPAAEAEIRLRRARGRMLAGDIDGARGVAEGWTDPASRLGGDLAVLADLADLLAAIGDFPRAVAVYRQIAHRAGAGSPRWFAARLGHARALESAGQPVAAKQILDGTSLLHPELGGPAMKDRFETMARKLETR